MTTTPAQPATRRRPGPAPWPAERVRSEQARAALAPTEYAALVRACADEGVSVSDRLRGLILAYLGRQTA
ncbi:hypothetical protein [Oryzihumus leptocrescens]|uniref:Ribbon-helix-helix CopG family protein n=1 Tax=Oryzihumus leptocrescens TaxID=297536 RepID=A0A542ZEH0_9MICO|nr:hypothetical protein [Oryzihumus leptocrescens]TQL58742.1 hypothetical protein FB474_0078 [Oryzihumus leptocrescens]